VSELGRSAFRSQRYGVRAGNVREVGPLVLFRKIAAASRCGLRQCVGALAFVLLSGCGRPTPQQILERVRKTYSTATDFQQSSRVTLSVGKGGKEATFSSKSSLAFRRPNRVRFESGRPFSTLLVCDGKKLYVYLKRFQAVIERAAPKDLKALRRSDEGRFLTSFPSDIDFRSLLAGEKVSGKLRGLRLEPGMPVLEGQRTYVLRANFRLSGAPKLEPNVGPGTQTFWIGSRDWLIRKIEIRLPWRRKGKGGAHELTMIEVVRRPRRNSGVTASVFAFRPGPGVRRVTSAPDTLGIGASSEPLIGSKAPDIKPARWLQGKIERAGMKGEVVILDFWATWCLPCGETLPHLQAVFEKNAGRGLLVVGIHVSQGEATSIMKMARENRLSYPLVIDSPCAAGRGFGETCRRYGVHKIPYTFVVDRRGMVRWAGHPMEPGFEEAVEEALEG